MVQQLHTRAKGAYEAILNVATSTASDRNMHAFAQLDALLKLPPGWDGYRGHAPAEAAIEHAKAFLANLSKNISLPAIEPSGDGEVNLVWRSPTYYLEIGFCGDDQYSFFGKSKSDPEERYFGDIQNNANRPSLTLLWLLDQFTDALPVRTDKPEREQLAWAS